MVFANKKLFKNSKGDIHVGFNAPDGFSEAKIEDVKKALNELGKRKLWRCFVCNDLSIAASPPETCPTCFQTDAYVQINQQEIENLLEIG